MNSEETRKYPMTCAGVLLAAHDATKTFAEEVVVYLHPQAFTCIAYDTSGLRLFAPDGKYRITNPQTMEFMDLPYGRWVIVKSDDQVPELKFRVATQSGGCVLEGEFCA